MQHDLANWSRIILAVSVTIQLLATVQAFRLGVLKWRTAWFLVAFANALMLIRRGVGFYRELEETMGPDVLGRSIGLLISTLMLVGLTLLLRWHRKPEPKPEQKTAKEVGEAEKLAKVRWIRQTAALIGIGAGVCCLGLGQVAYDAYRGTIENRTESCNLRTAALLKAAIEGAPNEGAAMGMLREMEEAAKVGSRAGEVDFVSEDGLERLDIGTARGREERAETGFLASLGENKSWSGRIRSLKGREELAGYVHSARWRGFVGVRTPVGETLLKAQAEALPWVAAMVLVLVLVIPISFFLLCHAGTISHEAASSAIEERRALEGRLTALVECVRDHAIFMLDRDGRVQTWNPNAAAIRGWKEHEIKGRRLANFYPEEERAAGQCEEDLKEAEKSGQVEREGWRMRADGTRYWANSTISALRGPGEELGGFLVVSKDGTERRKLNERIEELMRMYSVLSGINQVIVRERSPAAMMEKACRLTVDRGGFSMGWIGLEEEGTGVLVRRGVAVAGGSTGGGLESAFTAAGGVGERLCREVMRTGARAVANEAGEGEAVGQKAEDGGGSFRPMAALPLKVGGRTIGALGLISRKGKAFEGQELGLLDEMAEDLGFAIEVAQRDEVRRKAEDEVRAHLGELQRWHQLMLAREDRVGRLKAEVNELLEEAGRPARYASQGKR